MADFFTAVQGGSLAAEQHTEDDVKSFAAAINARFGNGGDQQQTARLLAPPLALRIPSTPMATLSIQQPSDFIPVPPSALSEWLNDPAVLILDIRPHAAYSSARISKAVSLSVPSTLLKRPLFSLQRISAMLPSHSARARFSAWRSSPRILVYDADSVSISETSNIHGLLRKFRAEAPDAEISVAWIQGGFQAVWALRRDCIDVVPPTPETETEDDEPEDHSNNRRVLRAHHLPRAAFGYTSTTQVSRTGEDINRPRRTRQHRIPGPPLLNPHLKLPSAPAGEADSGTASNPFYDNVRQNTELNGGITERIPLRLPRRVRRRISELPFNWLREIVRHAGSSTPPVVAASAAYGFGTFRGRPDSSEEDSSDSGTSLRNKGRWTPSAASPGPRINSVNDGTEALAMQFYRIELAEQRRLMDVMAHHTRESGMESSTAEKSGSATDSTMSLGSASTDMQSVASDKSSGNDGHVPFPFSITAGVEKGTKNRYRNIWPFEHARVRLQRQIAPTVPPQIPRRRSSEHDDYVNASYVQPLGTSRLYIATQGPLESTFGDFWTLVWQQNTHVIVMLTREVEGSVIKCGSYWRSGTYGSLRVELLGCAAEGCHGVCSVCAGADDTVGSTPGFFSGLSANNSRPPTAGPQLIKRTIRLTHAGYSDVPPRRVVQLQYLGWPDMNVPEDARGVLGLVWEVRRITEELGTAPGARPPTEVVVGENDNEDVDRATGVLHRALRLGDAGAPLLLHCSAGVGRTGGFIAVDAVLDAVRMEMRQLYGSGRVDDGRGIREVESSTGSDGWGRSTGSSGIDASRGITADLRVAAIAEDDRMDLDVSPPEMHTPMPVDTVGSDYVDMGKTRLWAEEVADTKVLSAFTATAAPSTYPSPTATAIASPVPFHLQAPAHRSTHSLTLPSTPHGVSAPNSPEKSTSLPIEINPTPGVVPLAVRRGHADHRMRTFSAPNAAPPLSLPSTTHMSWLLHQTPQSLPGKPESSLGNTSLSGRPLARSLSPFTTSNNTRPPVDGGEEFHDRMHVDYKEPRVLHRRGGAGPVRLSQFEDPIWEVLQDMREQRMSLCQSLRQYVFVHAAIVEGALMVVDEERARAGVTWRPGSFKLSLVTNDDGSMSASSTGKRQASPTELLKEDKKGEIALSKRPSIKRKQASGDAYPPPLSTFPPP
ncbi:hypothetical protein FB45DRAFT_1027618 [Roridomyces roridus]|uniref:protein-tyrosine-phosphatase n=1 Tax=Roridomyces roridus TaxID=1738132 RepID=A0AAD7BTR7_9AGAR|nr:hypothetical protein FB45DRAFT_1027618 [Roridomyces roridus]